MAEPAAEEGRDNIKGREAHDLDQQVVLLVKVLADMDVVGNNQSVLHHEEVIPRKQAIDGEEGVDEVPRAQQEGRIGKGYVVQEVHETQRYAEDVKDEPQKFDAVPHLSEEGIRMAVLVEPPHCNFVGRTEHLGRLRRLGQRLGLLPKLLDEIIAALGLYDLQQCLPGNDNHFAETDGSDRVGRNLVDDEALFRPSIQAFEFTLCHPTTPHFDFPVGHEHRAPYLFPSLDDLVAGGIDVQLAAFHDGVQERAVGLPQNREGRNEIPAQEVADLLLERSRQLEEEPLFVGPLQDLPPVVVELRHALLGLGWQIAEVHEFLDHLHFALESQPRLVDLANGPLEVPDREGSDDHADECRKNAPSRFRHVKRDDIAKALVRLREL